MDRYSLWLCYIIWVILVAYSESKKEMGASLARTLGPFSDILMKIVRRMCALLLSGATLFIGFETLLPQFPELVSKSTAIIFTIVGVFFAYYGITGNSLVTRK